MHPTAHTGLGTRLTTGSESATPGAARTWSAACTGGAASERAAAPARTTTNPARNPHVKRAPAIRKPTLPDSTMAYPEVSRTLVTSSPNTANANAEPSSMASVMLSSQVMSCPMATGVVRAAT